MLEYVDSLNDPRLDAYARLTELELRNRLEPEKGIFIAESQKVIERALDAGYEPLSLLIPAHRLERMQMLVDRVQRLSAGFRGIGPGVGLQGCGRGAGLQDSAGFQDGAGFQSDARGSDLRDSIHDADFRDGACGEASVPVFVAPAHEIEKLAGYELTRGVLCAMRRKPLLSVGALVKDARRIAVLENITNHTNVGAAFRSAAALGIDAVLVTPACCDPLYRRAVRVSMGAVFQVPWTRIGMTEDDAWPDRGLALLNGLGFKTMALALEDDSLSLDDPRLKAYERIAVVLGTEGDGLSRDTIASCDHTVRIPMAHGVDSLNVAAASAVAFWELRAR